MPFSNPLNCTAMQPLCIVVHPCQRLRAETYKESGMIVEVALTATLVCIAWQLARLVRMLRNVYREMTVARWERGRRAGESDL